LIRIGRGEAINIIREFKKSRQGGCRFATWFFLVIGMSLVSAQESVLFIGNSFTYGFGSPVKYYRTDTVTDLNNEGIGGVPALVKSFSDQAGLDFKIYLETRGGSGMDFHLENKLGVIGRRPWDKVVMHGYSTLNRLDPGNSDLLVETMKDMADFLRGLNTKVEIFLTATWSRADLVYVPNKPWTGESIEKMAMDVRKGYDVAAELARASVNPVGEAWNKAMESGLADKNPYDGIALDKIDLWTYDHYHASTFGYYLEALVVFGNLSGLDPRSLGENECSGFELGLSRAQVRGLQDAAYRQLALESRVKPAPLVLPQPVGPERCGEGL
jgi:hypothetical protein